MIIGCGGIAPAHIEGFLKFPSECQITALVNRNTDRCVSLKEKYNLDCEIFSDYHDALSKADVVAICTPPKTHKEMAITCLEAGMHVLCEKPFALSVCDCEDMIETAKRCGKIISSVAQSRFISPIRKVIEIVKSEKLGKVFHTDVHSHWYRGGSYYNLAWRGTWESEGGGCTLNHAVHHIDLLLWAKGMPVSVTSVFSNQNHNNSEEEDISLSILKFKDGTLASLTCSLLHHGEEQTFNFQGEKGGISIPFKATASGARENGFPCENEKGKAEIEKMYEEMQDLKLENHDGQIENFLRAIQHGDNLISSGEDGKNAIELITAIYKSAITNQTVTLPLASDDEYRTFEGRIKNAPHFFEKTESVDAFEDTFITSFKNKF